MATSPTRKSGPSISSMCRTTNSESPYSSIFGTLMPVAGVFDRQWMQVELALQILEFGRLRVGDGDPDKAVGMPDELTDLRDGDVGDLAAVAVGDAVDEHAIS